MYFPDLEVPVERFAPFAGGPAPAGSVLLPDRPHLGALVGQHRALHVRQDGGDPNLQGKDSHEEGEALR